MNIYINSFTSTVRPFIDNLIKNHTSKVVLAALSSIGGLTISLYYLCSRYIKAEHRNGNTPIEEETDRKFQEIILPQAETKRLDNNYLKTKPQRQVRKPQSSRSHLAAKQKLETNRPASQATISSTNQNHSNAAIQTPKDRARALFPNGVPSKQLRGQK